MTAKSKILKNLIPRASLLGALILGAGGLLIDHSEAAGTADETEPRWLLTDAAIARTAAGDCEDNESFKICREECVVHVPSGREEPTGNFACFPF